jgi:hypothetical protein
MVKFTPLPKDLTDEDHRRLKSYLESNLFPERELPIPVIFGPKPNTVKKYYFLLRQLARFSLLVHCDQTSLASSIP